MPQYFKDYGERLVELGYTIVPINPGTKACTLKDWRNLRLTASDVRRMAMNGSANSGAGINASDTPLIDVDVMDPAIADQMSSFIDSLFPNEPNLMSRTGRAPKFGVPCRSATPFRKISSSVYTDGKHDHKVEILGDGQQWVAYAIHPDTGRPYEYCSLTGDEGLLAVPHNSLPGLRQDDAIRVVNEFERIASLRVSAGLWRLKTSIRQREPVSGSDDPFAAHAQPVGASVSDVERLLSRIPNDDADYDDWFKVLAAAHHELGDEGREIARAWSAQSSKHTDRKFDQTWESLGRYSGRPLTLRALIKSGSDIFSFSDSSKTPTQNPGFLPAAAFAEQHGRAEWLIKHVLPKKSLIVVYGAPGSSKSFFVLDMVAAIARGIEWRGHRTRQTPVAYIAAEGVGGFGKRLEAYGRANEVSLSSLPVYVRGGAFLLKDDVVQAADQIRDTQAGVVVIDTLASVTPGANENTSEDMGQAIADAQFIIETTGASVILIHHANKNGEMRGWSGLLAAADNTIRVEGTEGLRTAYVEKQKEGATTGKYGYHLKVVELYTDEDGDPVSSCVIDPCDETKPRANGKRVSADDFDTNAKYAKARHYLHIIEELVGLDSTTNVSEDDIVKAIQDDETENPLREPDYPRARNIKRTLLTLGEKGKIRREGRWVRLCG